MKRSIFRINWDNGADACGTFPWAFDTYEAADAYGREWTDECNVRDFGTLEPDNGYSYDVIEQTDPEETAPEAEWWSERELRAMRP